MGSVWTAVSRMPAHPVKRLAELLAQNWTPFDATV
jgi:hypothetical protein